MKRIFLIGVVAIASLFSMVTADAQSVAIKTNLLGWAATSPNLGLEFGVGRKSTIQIFGLINPWTIDGRQGYLWNVEPEYRYWFCEKFNGHFIGIHALGGEYNLRNVRVPFSNFWGFPDLTGENNGRHCEGWYVGGGITYGYQWMLSKHWNLELSLGVGYAYSPYKYYGRCNRLFDKNGAPLAEGEEYSGKVHYFGPTKAALSFMYVF